MVELIITEKPSSAKKIAAALADGKPTAKKHKSVPYYQLTHKKKEIIVTSAVGHLYGLVEKNKNGWTYPTFDIEWQPSYQNSKDLDYIKDYITAIEKLAKQAKEFTVACDYDVEGEVIGLNVVRFACKQKDAHRMKFSTLTKSELTQSYEQKGAHLDWGQAYAGETRHKLDWLYGINLSRALTASVKAAGSFKVMSAGRVQGPALKLLVDREKEIQAFVPEPFWQISLQGEYKKESIEAWHQADKIFDKAQAEKIMQVVDKATTATITEITRRQRQQAPPTPFNLTDLQSEAYNQFKITPKQTLAIAQKLYLAGVTSYPRTSSQQLDPKLGFKNILTDLSKQGAYKSLAQRLLQTTLQPNNGKKTDPAHPAIYPTGQIPKGLEGRDKKVYDLIVKRFMATFGKPAVRETMQVTLDVQSESFITKGTRTVEPNWHVFYQPYVKLDEVTLPDMEEKETISVNEIIKHDKETQPPRRFNQSSIIKELEKRNLGTKATRADILDRLFQRGYITGVQITATKFGIETVDILEKYATIIVDEQLTAEFEEEMEKIREGKTSQEKILTRAKSILTKLLDEFKQKEEKIGEELLHSIGEARKAASKLRKLGVDPKSKKNVYVRIARYGPCAQLGEKDDKPQYAALAPDMKIEEVTLEQALRLFQLPRTLGKMDDGETIEVNMGRFGPYIKYGPKKYVGIRGDDSPFSITLQRAKELIQEKIEADANKVIHDYEEIQVLNGRYGPYITDGKKNVKIPKDKEPKSLTKEECQELLKKAPAKKKFARKKTARKKTTRKKSTKKK